MQGYRAKDVIHKAVLGEEKHQFKTLEYLLGHGYTSFKTEAGLAEEVGEGDEAEESASHGDKELFRVEDAPTAPLSTTDAFACYFVTPKACQLGSQSLRRMGSVDGCHTNSPYGLVLLIAVGYDANNSIFPLAWAVVSGENARSWTWFFRHLKAAYPWMSSASLALLSERQKGLIKAVRTPLPLATHYFSI